MSKTLIQTARANGDLMAFWDFRGGNLEDQSGNGITLTTPADAQLSSEGLRVGSTPASFPLDMSSTQNLGVFFLVEGFQLTVGNDQMIAELTASGTTSPGWQVLQFNTNANPLFRYGGSGGNTSRSAINAKRSDSYFFSGHFDRRLSFESIKTYNQGVFDTSTATDNNTNDGTAFADDTVYLMGRSGGTLLHTGLLQAFGIVDFTTNQWSATDQATLYAEIRDRETL